VYYGVRGLNIFRFPAFRLSPKLLHLRPKGRGFQKKKVKHLKGKLFKALLSPTIGNLIRGGWQ